MHIGSIFWVNGNGCGWVNEGERRRYWPTGNFEQLIHPRRSLTETPHRMLAQSVRLSGLGYFASFGRFPLKRFHYFVACLVTVCMWSSLHRPTIAGEFNSVLDIGDPAPPWTDLPTTDGKTTSLKSLQDAKLIVVVFTCNSCPYATDVEERLIELTNKYADSSVVVVAINVNTIEEDAMPAMQAKAKSKSFPFIYAFDETQQIARDYGAKYTPEFFVLDQQRRVAYMGSLDDSPNGQNVTQRHVQKAIDGLLAGQEIAVTETVPIGCRIRMERQRRSRKK
ncbi:AhpC/TSA family protein [Allorhodopirellula heiligendammensis]|uniref:AhpC/TSA family protein n=1 Tax=Allorhodopirellula heiligendammensis TaxID=2714739 RepID=A0A5C6BYR4_9BACT|nr:AhpC/TSA family protein [Allorhodopirellula heiligendammensis]